jgi:TatA/E family protein of Tat protein translocase
MGPIGVQEMIVIFLIALVLFGPKKLPELGRTIGKAITEFRRASNDLKSTFDREMQNLERENESLKEVAHSLDADIRSHSDLDTHTYYETPPYSVEPYGSTASNPPTVSASEVPGAESQGIAETATPQHAVETVEGTIPRTEAPPSEVASAPAVKVEPHPAVETPQHS